MALTMVACSSNDASTSSVASDTQAAGSQASDTQSANGEYTTIKDGTLMVGVEIGYPPMEYYDTDGVTPIGFDIEVAKAVADYLGLQVEYVDTAWDGIFAGVNVDKYDCIISSVSITDDRKESLLLTSPYVGNQLVLLTPVDSEITSLETLSGHSTCVQAETTADDYMKEHAAELGCDLNQYDKVLNCFDELKTGRVDSVFVDSVVASYYLGEDANAYHTVWQNTELEPIGIALKKGNDALANKIDEALEALTQDGTLIEISQKFFGDDLVTPVRTN
jgi:polar amino acid transport system substrate-binding protein